jgi:hypothetical protein
MKFFDWLLRRDRSEPPNTGLSRRDFFARVAGRNEPGATVRSLPGAQAGPAAPGVERLYTFPVAAFPYHDGPVLVPMLRVGMEFSLTPEPGHLTDPEAVRIEWRRDHLGYVPADRAADVRARLGRGERLICRASHIDPTAELSRVLTVEIVLDQGMNAEAAEPEAPPDSTPK